MDIIQYLKNIIRDFFAICSCILIGSTVFLLIYHTTAIDSSLLWQIIVVSLAAAFLDIIYYSNQELSKRAHLVRSAIHFILVNVLLFLSAYFFKWFEFKDKSIIIIFALIILLVYILVYISIYFIDSAQAKKLNKKLEEYRKKRSEEIE